MSSNKVVSISINIYINNIIGYHKELPSSSDFYRQLDYFVPSPKPPPKYEKNVRRIRIHLTFILEIGIILYSPAKESRLWYPEKIRKTEMGKAKYPHDASRPEPARIRKALEANDIKGVIQGLTVRQRRFAEEFVLDYNGTAAAIRAGYATEWADRQAHLLNKHEGVKAYIDHLTRSKESQIMSIDPDYVIKKVVDIVTKEDSKDGDKLRGLELLARHLGMFIDRTEITGKDGGAIAVEQQRLEEEVTGFTNALKRMKKPPLKLVGE